jgi:hypothetical protein
MLPGVGNEETGVGIGKERGGEGGKEREGTKHDPPLAE